MNSVNDQIAILPPSPGIYLFKDNDGKVIYVGKAKNLNRRVKSYFQGVPDLPKTEILVSHISSLDYISVNSEFEALLLEAELIKKYKPKYNVILKDDKHYIYIKITREEFPRILYARRIEGSSGDFFGPYPAAGTVKEIIVLLRKIFPFCNQNRSVQRRCFYCHIGLCNPCPADIKKLPAEEFNRQKSAYRRNIISIKRVLSGKLTKVKNDSIKEMDQFSKEQRFEEAAALRDKIRKLNYLNQSYHKPESYLRNPHTLYQIRQNEQHKLTEILKTYFNEIGLLQKIECYDISNISGKLAVGSLVTFIDGEPAKEYYRRFRIKTKNTPDDFAMLKEVIRRRLSHTDWTYPNLFVVDGGVPQVATMLKVLSEKKIDIPLVGLAKKDEEMIIPYQGEYVRLKLEKGSAGLSLIQRLRDEAHRFAHKYHELLRLKYLLSPS